MLSCRIQSIIRWYRDEWLFIMFDNIYIIINVSHCKKEDNNKTINISVFERHNISNTISRSSWQIKSPTQSHAARNNKSPQHNLMQLVTIKVPNTISCSSWQLKSPTLTQINKEPNDESLLKWSGNVSVSENNWKWNYYWITYSTLFNINNNKYVY